MHQNRLCFFSNNLCWYDTLQCCHKERDDVSNHRRLDCLLHRLFRRRSKKTSKLRVTCMWGEPPVTGGFPSQRVSYAENISIWWRHDDVPKMYSIKFTSMQCVLRHIHMVCDCVHHFRSVQVVIHLCVSNYHSHWGNHTIAASATEEALGPFSMEMGFPILERWHLYIEKKKTFANMGIHRYIRPRGNKAKQITKIMYTF